METEQIESNVKVAKRKREFDFTRYPERRIALLFLYLGWEFDGMVMQPDVTNTTEGVILSALEKVKIIRSKEYSTWNRCGRTDKGVSGFRQVGSCIVRSTDVNGKFVQWPVDSTDVENRVSTSNEMNYSWILNHNLPPSVRVLAWAPVQMDFNARFNCKQRVYNYIFPRTGLNLKEMQEAAGFLVGLHDFRNFCQIDNNKCRLESSYERQIFSAEITELSPGDQSSYQMCKLTVKGSGFLWHQIRFIVGLLFDVGSGKEEPSIVSELLNIQKYPARPQYTMAKDLPLCFFDCSYDLDLEWNFDSNVLKEVFTSLQKSWIELQIKAEQIKSMMDEISNFSSAVNIQNNEGLSQFIRGSAISKTHISILKRPLCESLDSRIARATKKRAQIEAENEES